MELKLEKYTYLKDEYGQTVIYSNENVYDSGSKSLRYLLDYIELLEKGRDESYLDELRMIATLKDYDFPPFEKRNKLELKTR
ncbi:hypothetical protein M3649_03900 [Ureibacillus chungkukjangi]|uniref:hypothetical protein n=1 Tax=Ureibacillus chungkukjangi TaxID=1202712 RepID=UPI00203C1FE8|nr:hypothetical protein [Ureibacillus chungkukjangi]MCM3387275.1 hypothetical protein [Ureibacillus chungkukjangi]